MMRRFPISQPSLTALETEFVTATVQSGWVSSIGKSIDEFEARFAQFCGVKHAIAVSNGTVALHLALKALGIGPGDEVIVPDLTFIATANTVVMAGATPVFADIDRESLCLSSRDLERCLTKHTRAIMPVHLYGHPADMPAINDFAARHGLIVIEDAAEAHGAAIGGKRVGGLGRCAGFSFYGNKIITTGEGGAVTTDDTALAERCRLLRDHAMSKTKRYWHEELGYNYRMTNLQAALGCAQLQRADELIAGRSEVLGWYRGELSGVRGITLNRACPWASPTTWLVCAEIEGISGARRDVLMDRLKERGVDSRPYFYPQSDMPHMTKAQTPIAHEISASGFNLPTYIGLTRDDVAHICRALREALETI